MVAESTWKGYESKLRLYLLPRIGHMRMGEVSPADLEAVYAWMTGERGLSARSAQYAHATAHRMWTDAVRWGDVGYSPAVSAKAPTVPKRPKSAWNEDESARFLEFVSERTADAAADQHGEGSRPHRVAERRSRWEPMWWLLADAACRRSELVRLEWGDVDLDAGTVTIGHGKTDSARRTLSLLPETVELLRRWRVRVIEERMVAGDSWVESDRIFVWEDGRPITADWLSHQFRKVRDAAGVRRIRLHDLRHSWATQALRADVSMTAVSARLGHSSIRVTADFYTDVPSDVDRDAAVRVGGRWRAHGTRTKNPGQDDIRRSGTAGGTSG